MTTRGRETMPYAVAENVAHQWGESVTILRDGKPLGVVLPGRGF